MERLPAKEFLEKARHVPVIDVRSPSEFSRGHIPGALSIPLFDDVERSDVGTLYHKAGREEAIKKGLEIVGPKMKSYVEWALKSAKDGELMVYCWRGGMRSESMAWLFETSGIKASVLENGYKGFRNFIHGSFERNQPMIIIGGMTGSGKTELLRKISDAGFPVTDLESLANHKGSVFGSLGMPEQPSNEHFVNLLGMSWNSHDHSVPVFLEDESLNIGRDSIPKPLYEKMQRSYLFYVDMPLEARVERLFIEYAHFPAGQLNELIGKISRRLGGTNASKARKAVEEGRLKDAIRIILVYYDKAYGFDVGNRARDKIITFKVQDDSINPLAKEMIRKAKELFAEHEITGIP